MSNYRIHQSSVDIIQNALRSLGNDGVDNCGPPAADKALSYPVDVPHRYLTDGSEFLEAMNAMHKLREARATLSLLSATLDRTLESLRSATYPAVLARGIESLPDEVLSHIFKIASAARRDVPPRLSWVSRRFRAVALATPQIWSALPVPQDASSHQELDAFLQRSKNVGIEVELPLMITQNYEWNPEWDQAIKQLMPHKHRWVSLSLDLTSLRDDLDEAPSQKAHFPKATFDAVESLCIGDSPERMSWPDYGAEVDLYSDAGPEFYSSWKFPNVRTLSTEMHVPPPGVFHSLVDLSIDLSLHDLPSPTPNDPYSEQTVLKALANFLNSMPTLQSLKFAVGEYEWLTLSERITLPSLTKLYLTSHIADMPTPPTLRTFAHTLDIPSVESISLQLRISRTPKPFQRYDDLLEALFPRVKELGKLKQVRVEYTMEKNLAMIVLREAPHFPSLEELEICTSSAPQITGLTEMLVRQETGLRRIRFRDDHGQANSLVREYTIKEDGSWLDTYLEPSLS